MKVFLFIALFVQNATAQDIRVGMTKSEVWNATGKGKLNNSTSTPDSLGLTRRFDMSGETTVFYDSSLVVERVEWMLINPPGFMIGAESKQIVAILNKRLYKTKDLFEKRHYGGWRWEKNGVEYHLNKDVFDQGLFGILYTEKRLKKVK